MDVMRGMNNESVDLIYLDPPFNSNADYSAPIGSEAAGAAFKDTWTLSDVDEAWHGEIADRQPALYAIIDAANLAHGKNMTPTCLSVCRRGARFGPFAVRPRFLVSGCGRCSSCRGRGRRHR